LCIELICGRITGRQKDRKATKEESMHETRRWVAACAVALLVAGGAPRAQQDDPDRTIAGGGVTVKGWQGKTDPAGSTSNKQGLTINDAKFAPEGDGFRVTTGAAGLYWNPANAGKGDYSVRATFTEARQTYNHPHPFGVFIAGSQLETDHPNALYCAAYRNGNYLVRGFSHGKPFQVIPKVAPHEAVKKAGGPDEQVVQDVALQVRGDRVECVINGAVVWSGSRADVVGEGRLASTDGIAGIRVSHNSDALVTNFSVK
jgi:hypothetical protein